MDWKERFLKLYTDGDVVDYGRALELKSRNLQEKLYRFRSVDNLGFVEDELKGNIFLPYIGSLNDPFDSCSLLESGNPSELMDAKEFQENLIKTTDRKIPSEIFEDPDWFKKVVEHMMQTSDESLPQNTPELLSSIIREEFEKVNGVMNDVVRTTSRVACFTEKLTNLPMWAHYACQHSGICMEYDIKSIESEYIKSRLFPVFYVRKLPSFVSLSQRKQMLPFMMTDYLAIHKLEDWKYEKEWRLVIVPGHEGYSEETMRKDMKGKGMAHKFSRPKKVYLGAKIDETKKKVVLNLCHKCGVDVMQMQCTEYGLQAVQITE